MEGLRDELGQGKNSVSSTVKAGAAGWRGVTVAKAMSQPGLDLCLCGCVNQADT